MYMRKNQQQQHADKIEWIEQEREKDEEAGDAKVKYIFNKHRVMSSVIALRKINTQEYQLLMNM